ncbi:hypothetical protein SEA_GIBBOUS_28 [Gordonia phage Gibbous]|uniref:DUF7257 domain-containing protein n=1 Tax=Gordonia phage Gibbous TaxID=2652405 RepID=A0A5J6T3W0_9CAUD|nr:hypothetical protein QLQ74_gp28 [Gordonia phage Gibbous]QFG05104.1 hypothetical protein SEA_GIBBOUS_28 [Gordonia phage Gibbous]
MPVYLGSTPISALYLGSTPLKALTLGDTLLWPILASASDDFNRSDSYGLGDAWTIYGTSGNNRASIVSNTARSNIATTDGTYYSRCRYESVRMNTDDQYVRAKIAATGSPASGRISAINLRVNDSGEMANTVGLYFENNTAYIGSAIGGTFTNRSGTLSAVAANDVFELRAVGRVFTAYRNGSSIGSWNDSGALTNMGAGYRSGGLAVTSARLFFTNYYSYSLDDWAAGDLSPV